MELIINIIPSIMSPSINVILSTKVLIIDDHWYIEKYSLTLGSNHS